MLDCGLACKLVCKLAPHVQQNNEEWVPRGQCIEPRGKACEEMTSPAGLHVTGRQSRYADRQTKQEDDLRAVGGRSLLLRCVCDDDDKGALWSYVVDRLETILARAAGTTELQAPGCLAHKQFRSECAIG